MAAVSRADGMSFLRRRTAQVVSNREPLLAVSRNRFQPRPAIVALVQVGDQARLARFG